MPCLVQPLCCPLTPTQSEKLLLYDSLRGELQERIQRLEEDRRSLDLSSGEGTATRATQSLTLHRGSQSSGPPASPGTRCPHDGPIAYNSPCHVGMRRS